MTGTIAKDHLRSFIERIERLEEEKASLADDIREVYSEAKSSGFDPRVMRQVVRLRKMDDTDRREQEMVLDTYLHALGMTPIEQAIADANGSGGDGGLAGEPVAQAAE